MEDNCIIHCCGSENPNVSRFTDSNWEKIKKCAASYLTNPSSKLYLLSEKLPKFKSGGYHTSCYRRFTAVSSSHTSSATPRPSTSQCDYHLRSDASNINVSPTGVFGDVCIFCTKKVRKVNQKNNNTVSAHQHQWRALLKIL